MRKRGAVWAMAIVVGPIGLAACGSSSPSASTTSTTAIAPAAALATGTYTPAGASGTPHYIVTITSAESTEFDGAMKFVYEDGTTSLVFDFSGKVTGQSAVATPTKVVSSGSATRTAASVPNVVRLDVGADTLTFEGCQAYLPLVHSSSACTFIQPG